MSRSRIHLSRGALSALILVAAPAFADDAKPAAANSGEETAKKNPQVRTYSSVTVLSDPAKAPPLPSRTANPAANQAANPTDRPRPTSERPPREERGAGAGAGPGDRNRVESVRELRQEIREMRRDLRNEDRGVRSDHDRPDKTAPRADGNRPDKPRDERTPDRRLERERVRENLSDRRADHPRKGND